ncbi:MAG: hypothetical protein WDZ69_03300 [Candidatus Pacearchaeota archaeon]
MTILNFLKKFARKKKAPEPEPEKQKLSFSELGAWLDEKEKENKQKEKEIFSSIKERTDAFEKEAEEKIKVLEGVDVDSKKADERLKSQSKEGREKYVGFVKELIQNFKSLEEESLQQTVSKFESLFATFAKKAGKSYERATILIGKEARELHETTKEFSNKLKNIFKNNDELIQKSKTISLLKKRLKYIRHADSETEKFQKEIEEAEEKIKEKQEESKKLLKETEEIKESNDYKNYLEKQNKQRSLREEIDRDIFSLRQLIDFKTLGNFYHQFSDKMEIIKSYRDDFRDSFNEDKGKRILELIEKANLPNERFKEKINKIEDRNKELSNVEDEIKEDKSRRRLSELTSKITNTTMELGGLRSKKSVQEAKLEKLKINKGQITEKIKEDVNNVGAEITN